ncbi:hypothetical protein AB4Z39_13780 [Mycobacterium adipatum]|uniref:hypothetical protein n=1 Tax=Mycobacterium adipatum TaxID=1682113 RepID=UPI0034E0D4F0
MATMDALARAEISSRPWYVAARRGRDAINLQAFARLRPGRRLTSRTWSGFRLFEEPAYMVNFGWAHLYMPWEVWEVRPMRVLGYEPMLHHEARQIRARQLQVVHRMPPGFEFGPNGPNVRRLIEQLAQAQRKQPDDRRQHRDYEIAMTFLEDQRGPSSWLHDARVSLACTYLDCLTSGSATGPIGRWTSHVAARLPARTLIDAAVSGLSIPEAVALQWGLSSEQGLNGAVLPNDSPGRLPVHGFPPWRSLSDCAPVR